MQEYKAGFLRRLKTNDASTLILAVWALLLLSTFAIELGYIVRQKMTLVRRLENRDKRFRIAEAGVKLAIAQLRKQDILYEVDFLGERWSNQRDVFKNKRLGKGYFTVSYQYNDGQNSRTLYGIQDENSKINLNAVDVDVIIRLLQSTANMNRREAEELAYAIVDWRDKDSQFGHPQFGSEDSDYRGRKFSYEAKDSDYEALDELLLVHKMDMEIFEKLRHFVTVYGSGKVNINTAPRIILLALGIQHYVVDNILLFRNGGDSVAGTGDDNIFLETSTIVSQLSQMFDLSPSEIASLSNAISEGKISVKSDNFMIHSSGVLDYRDGETKIIAVSDRTGKIKYWREEIKSTIN